MRSEQRHPLKQAHDQLVRAEQMRQSGRLAEAQKICEEALREHPSYVAVLHTLGLVLADKKEYAKALPHLIQASMFNPRDWKTLTVLAGVYLRLGASEAATRTLEQARKIDPDNANIHATLGEIYRDEREYEAAANAYRDALKQDPTLQDVLSGLGSCLKHMGKSAEAADAYQELLKEHSKSIYLLSAISQLPPSLINVDILDLAEKAERRPDQSEDEFKSAKAFTRAFALHNSGDYTAAWSNLIAANAPLEQQHEKSFRSDFEVNQRILSDIRGQDALANARLDDKNSKISLFVLGPSRSGKTTTEYLASTLKGVKRGYENQIVENSVRYSFQNSGLPTRDLLLELPPALDDMFRQYYSTELEERAGSADIFTNTHPGHIVIAGRAATVIPNARFLFIKRDIDDITLRIFMKKYRQGNYYAYSIRNIRAYVQWYYDMIDILTEKLPDTSMVLNYEDLVSDPQEARKSIAELCACKNGPAKNLSVGDDRGCATDYIDLDGFK